MSEYLNIYTHGLSSQDARRFAYAETLARCANAIWDIRISFAKEIAEYEEHDFGDLSNMEDASLLGSVIDGSIWQAIKTLIFIRQKRKVAIPMINLTLQTLHFKDTLKLQVYCCLPDKHSNDSSKLDWLYLTKRTFPFLVV